MNTYSSDEFNALVEQVRDLSNKTDLMADSIALIDASVNKTKYLTKLLDVNVSYPAENDVLVYDKTGKWKNAQYDEIGLKPGEGGGESDIYVIAIGDETPATNENVYSAARIIEDWVSSKNDDTIEGNITFTEGKNLYIDGIQSRFASQGADLGSGFIYKIKDGGSSYLEVDELTVRKAASFNTLEIKKITSVGGNLIVSPASNNIIKVEETTQYYENTYQSVWRCIFREEIKDNNDELINQIKTDFQPGDLAKIQEFNVLTGVSQNVKNRFYWGKVLGVGKNYIDLSKTDIDPATNTQPMAGDALVMYGHKGDTYEDLKRLNVISISAYADNAPAILMYQGLNDYNTTNKSIIELAYDSAETQLLAYMNVYGRMYIGTKDRETSYIKYDPTANDGAGLLTVKATILVKDPDNEGNVTLIEGGYIRTNLIKTDLIITTDLLSKTISSGEDNLNINDNFIIKPNGDFECNSGIINNGVVIGEGVVVNGDISGASGTIGGFTIESNRLYSSQSLNLVELSPSQIRFEHYRSTGFPDNTITISNNGIDVSSYDDDPKDVSPSLKLYKQNVSLSVAIRGAITTSTIGYYNMDTSKYGDAPSNLPINSYYLITKAGEYYLPTIIDWLDLVGFDSISGELGYFYNESISIPIFILVLLSSNLDTVTIHGGSGRSLNERPLFEFNDAAKSTYSLTIKNGQYIFGYLTLTSGTRLGRMGAISVISCPQLDIIS